MGQKKITPSRLHHGADQLFGYGQELEDGTNIAAGTPFRAEAETRSLPWYDPAKSKASLNWKDQWARLRSRFEEIIDECRPVECVLVQVRIPAYLPCSPELPMSLPGRTLLLLRDSLSRGPSILSTPDWRQLDGLFPIRSVKGEPLLNRNGKPQAFRFGLQRQFFVCEPQACIVESRPPPVPRLTELARDGTNLLYQLPANVALSLWRNWPSGFSKARNSSESLWLDALFELSWQHEPGSPLHTKRFAWVGHCSYEFLGDGLFPRLPDWLARQSDPSIPHENGYPMAYYSNLPDVARASVAAIDEILAREKGPQRTVRVPQVRTTASPPEQPVAAQTGLQIPAGKCRLVILVHGIRTRAEWQGRIRHLLEADGQTIVEAVGYEYFDVFRFLCPFWTRRKPIRVVLKKIRDALKLHRGRFDELVIVAHSFGTYIIGAILRENPEIEPNRLLLCGCILPASYPWDQLPNRPTTVLNEAGSRDIWPILAKSATWGFGSTGTFGFLRPGVRDRWHNLAHSDYFRSGFAEEYWVRWILDGELKATPYETGDRPPTPFYKNLFEVFPIKWMVLLLLILGTFAVVRPLISRHRTALNSVPEPPRAEVPLLSGVFQSPSPELQVQLDTALTHFKSRYADWRPTIRVEVEAGSMSRRKLAEALGSALQKHSLGGFASGLLSIGNAPDAPITLSFGGADDSCAKAFRQAIASLISGETAFRRDPRLATNLIRLYLNGDPLFGPAGQATIQ